ncbi:MAG: hypothetical protein UY96_C0002G0005 [Parcubacteria group bacterium GW2011_GWB1_56_8]|nr:MAG: hypothetical protein UY96_C0002G0005 [Parcubacteria group bacterium GW2011_GWB1_56_8]
MNKSVSKRLRFTKTGKIMRRRMATNHSRTRKSQKNLMHKRGEHTLDFPRKAILNYSFSPR